MVYLIQPESITSLCGPLIPEKVGWSRVRAEAKKMNLNTEKQSLESEEES